MKQPNISTTRLILRPFELTDASNVQRLAGNFNVAKTTLNIPHPYEDGMAEKWIAKHKYQWEHKTHAVFAIEITESKTFIGVISLFDATIAEAKLGYWIGEPYWGYNYCTEASAAIIRFAFKNLYLERIFAEHLTSNPASGRVMQKVGMTKFANRLIRDRNNNDSIVAIYEIINPDFNKK